MAEVSHPGSIDAECRFQIVVCRERIELRGRVGWLPSQRHVAAILRQHDSVSGTGLYGAGPFQLPHGEVSISVEAEKDSRCSPGIADDETGKELAIRSAVANAVDLYRVFIKTRRLEEYPLLGLPKKRQ